MPEKPTIPEPHYYIMAPQTAWSWMKISFEAADQLKASGYLSDDTNGLDVASLIHKVYVDASKKSKQEQKS